MTSKSCQAQLTKENDLQVKHKGVMGPCCVINRVLAWHYSVEQQCILLATSRLSPR